MSREQKERVTGSTLSDADRDVLTADEAAKLLRLGRNQLYEAAGRGEIPHRRIGRSYRFSRSALIAWMGCSAQKG